MKTRLFATLITLLFFSAAKTQIIFDLADTKINTETVDITEKPVIVFKSLIPAYEYSFEVEMHEITPPIPVKSESAGLKFFGEDTDEDIIAFKNALQKFNEAKKEQEVPALYAELEKRIKKLQNDHKCEDCVTQGQAALEKSVYSKYLSFTLHNNQEITVTARRMLHINGKDSVMTWVKTFKTPSKTPWHILYGFTFVPNWMNPVPHYYCDGDSGAYRITRLHNQSNYFFKNISPTLMIGWTPMNKYSFHDHWGRAFWSNNFYQVGFTAGLSMNFASESGSISALVAPSLVFSDNVSLSFGACFTQKQVLKGQYQEGDVVKENLDFDQLHEKQYMGEWFISLAIRFEKNPFEKKDSK